MKIAAKPGPPESPSPWVLGRVVRGAQDPGESGTPGGSGLLAAAEGDIRVRSLGAPRGLGTFALEFEKQLAAHFLNHQQTLRERGGGLTGLGSKRYLNF